MESCWHEPAVVKSEEENERLLAELERLDSRGELTAEEERLRDPYGT